MNKDHPLIQIILGSIFHSTSVSAYKKIREDGFIRPNVGIFPYSHEQSRGSCVSRLQGISLFDFGRSEDEIFFMDGPLPWENVIAAHEPVSVIIQLNRKLLEENLISWEETKEKAGEPPCMLIPYVEVCYPQPIPLNFIERNILVCAEELKIFKIIDEQILLDEHF